MRTFLALLTAMAVMFVAPAYTAHEAGRHRVNPDSGPVVERVIKMTAKRFVFTPDSITVKKGQPVVIEITSADVPHGFSIPDFTVRTDVSPGKTSQVHFTPNKTGDFTFTCDVFCGSGHEDMSGTLKVIE